MDGRMMAGGVLAVAASVLGGFAMVHSRSAGERARAAESKLEDLSARLQRLEGGSGAPAAEARPTDGTLGIRVADLERRMDELARPAGAPSSAHGSAPSARSTPAAGADESAERGRQVWASLPQEDRRAVLELVKEAQKELRQQEVWGWAKGIQASFTKSLREKLQLTPVQEDRVSAVLKVYLPEMNKVWHDPEGTPEEQAAKSNELWAKVDAEIGPLLTGEQALQYEAWRKEQAEKAKKHSESGGR